MYIHTSGILVQSSSIGSAAPPTEAGAIHAHLGPALGPGGQRPGFEHLAPPKAPPHGGDFFHGKVLGEPGFYGKSHIFSMGKSYQNVENLVFLRCILKSRLGEQPVFGSSDFGDSKIMTIKSCVK